jgi:hypothetical protein
MKKMAVFRRIPSLKLDNCFNEYEKDLHEIAFINSLHLFNNSCRTNMN